jgi:hypothetical protein
MPQSEGLGLVDEAVSEVHSIDPATGQRYVRLRAYLRDGFERERREYDAQGNLLRHQKFAPTIHPDGRVEFRVTFDSRGARP